MTQAPATQIVARRTQAARRDESGRGLLRAAVEVVAEQGVSAATLESIGLRAGYSRGLATQRFGSKQKLIEAVIEHLHERQLAAVAEHRIDQMPGLDALLAYVDLYLRNLSLKGEDRAYFMLLSAAVADAAPLREAFAAEHGRIERQLEALVLRGQAEGNVRRELDADAVALMIGSLLLGLSMQQLVDPNLDLDPIRETSLATLRLSFGTPPMTGKA